MIPPCGDLLAVARIVRRDLDEDRPCRCEPRNDVYVELRRDEDRRDAAVVAVFVRVPGRRYMVPRTVYAVVFRHRRPRAR